MTSAEYRTLRELCGLTLNGAAQVHGLSIRTVQHWEEGRNQIPPGKSIELVVINARIEREIAMALTTAKKRGDAVLIRYRSDQEYQGSRYQKAGIQYPCHNALIARLKIALDRAGVPARIIYSGEE